MLPLRDRSGDALMDNPGLMLALTVWLWDMLGLRLILPD